MRYDVRSREKIVVTVARFTSDKNLHLIPETTHGTRDYRWHLIGFAESTSSGRCIGRQALTRIKERANGLGANNHHIHPDSPRAWLKSPIQRAGLCIDPPLPEHFDIAVMEAMSAELTSIVNGDSGACLNIVFQLDDTLGYTNPEDRPAIFYNLGSESSRLDQLADKAMAYTSKFNPRGIPRKTNGTLMNSGLLASA